ncbi:MAG: DEAD/DEAH box helicase [Flavobacteriales bacterium]|nr:DEAD/DEAH box helicase [Flavobacteriales bacterium]
MIAEKLFELPSFTRQYGAIQAFSVGNTLSNLNWCESQEALLGKINWDNLLGIASILSLSSKSEHLEAALRISQSCLRASTSPEQKAGAIVVLESLTNQPALELAKKRQLIEPDLAQQLPLPFRLQTNRTRIENSAIIDNEVVSLNRFQKEAYDASLTHAAVSISAPTSAGKSFILSQLLSEWLVSGRCNIVYIVPTRALISQVEEDLRKLITSRELVNVNLTTVPLNETANSQINLYVFTQERLHWFLTQPGTSSIDYLVVDEAHKIDNGNRGILLQRKLEEVKELNPRVRIFFSSPFTSNPEALLNWIGDSGSSAVVNTEFVAVNQNLLYLTPVKRKPMLWNVSLVSKAGSVQIGTINLEDRPVSEAKKISLLAKAISGNVGGGLIYANGAAEAESNAKILMGLSPDESQNSEINELIKLVKSSIHRDYSLAKVLGKGVAFHYGNMPLLIRQEIERLFKLNQIKYLVCTSTLLEGVNLPATSVFIKKPTRGRGKPLNENDFWNLAGRAGRWGKEFSGNIVCIEPDRWEIKPSPFKRKQRIEKALDLIKEEELIDFILEDTPRSVAENRQDLEFAFSYYYSRFLQDKLVPKTDFIKKLLGIFESLKDRIAVPSEIIFRNPGISPIAQQQLLEYFESKQNELESLIPVYPEDAAAVDEYTKLIGRIGKTLADFQPKLNYSRAILLVNWMSGKPLSYLISSSYRSYKKSDPKVKIDKVCRDTMEQVENFARFRFAKEYSCYVDILRHYISEINRPELLDDIPDLNLWLEFGVSQTTQLSFLSLGLSRNTVIAITEFLTDTKMDKQQCLDWLAGTDLSVFDFSPILIADIRRVLDPSEKS